MGNFQTCCSDGVLVAGKGMTPIGVPDQVPHFGGEFGGALPQTPLSQSKYLNPAVNTPVPPTQIVSAIQNSEQGPSQRDGYFLEGELTISTGAFNIIPYRFQPVIQHGVRLKPFKFYKTRHTYSGQWANHKFHGEGVLMFENGDYLIGTFANGSPVHARLLLFSQQCYFEGSMRNWHAEGEGLLSMANGAYLYRGNFVNGEAEGIGYEQTNQTKFQGQFCQAQKTKGVLNMAGYTYQGDFRNNVFHGVGKLTSPNGQYTGQFVNGKKSGNGNFRWRDGSTYQGGYLNDKKHGYGRYVSADGFKVNQGQWDNGRFFGNNPSSAIIGSPMGGTSRMGDRSVIMTPITNAIADMPRPAVPRMTGVSTYLGRPSTPINSMAGLPAPTLSIPGPSTYTPPAMLGSNYNPTSPSAYTPPGITVNSASNYVPASSMYMPGSASNYTPGAGSLYMPPGAGSMYTPPGLHGQSNMSFRPQA